MASKKRKPKLTGAEVYQLFVSLPLSEQWKFVWRCEGQLTNAVGIRLICLWGDTKRGYQVRNPAKPNVAARRKRVDELHEQGIQFSELLKHHLSELEELNGGPVAISTLDSDYYHKYKRRGKNR